MDPFFFIKSTKIGIFYRYGFTEITTFWDPWEVEVDIWSDVTIAGRTDNKQTRKDRATQPNGPWTAEMSKNSLNWHINFVTKFESRWKDTWGVSATVAWQRGRIFRWETLVSHLKMHFHLILSYFIILSATAKIRSKVEKYLRCGRSGDASSGEKHQFLWLCKWNLELRQIWGIGKTYFGPKEIQCHQSNHFIMKPRAPVEALFLYSSAVRKSFDGRVGKRKKLKIFSTLIFKKLLHVEDLWLHIDFIERSGEK